MYCYYCTVIRFVSFSAFGICSVVGLSGALVEAKTHSGHLNVRILASKSVPLRPMTVQMPNLALIETERITVCKLITSTLVSTITAFLCRVEPSYGVSDSAVLWIRIRNHMALLDLDPYIGNADLDPRARNFNKLAKQGNLVFCLSKRLLCHS